MKLATLANGKRDGQLVVVDALPHTGAGKVAKPGEPT